MPLFPVPTTMGRGLQRQGQGGDEGPQDDEMSEQGGGGRSDPSNSNSSQSSGLSNGKVQTEVACALSWFSNWSHDQRKVSNLLLVIIPFSVSNVFCFVLIHTGVHRQAVQRPQPGGRGGAAPSRPGQDVDRRGREEGVPKRVRVPAPDLRRLVPRLVRVRQDGVHQPDLHEERPVTSTMKVPQQKREISTAEPNCQNLNARIIFWRCGPPPQNCLLIASDFSNRFNW